MITALTTLIYAIAAIGSYWSWRRQRDQRLLSIARLCLALLFLSGWIYCTTSLFDLPEPIASVNFYTVFAIWIAAFAWLALLIITTVLNLPHRVPPSKI